jgi:hypothetical protein
MSYDDALKLAKGLQEHCPESLKGGIMSKAVVKKQDQAVAAYEGATGVASNIGSEDMRLPRIALIQAMSPTAQDGTHKAGELVNSLTQEVLPQPLVIVPAFVFKNVIKWKPREQGGGIIYRTTNITEEVKRDLAWVGDQKPAATAFINAVCLVEGQGDMPLIVSFCNTSYKAGQDLATLTYLKRPAWRYTYELSAKKVTNTKGTFHVFNVKLGKPATEEQMKAAADLYENVKNMSIDTDYEGAHGGTVDTTATEDTEPQEF